MTEKHEYVTPGELASKIETVEAKLDTLKWQGIAALAGGQVVAGVAAALITRTTPADAGRTALQALGHFF